MGPEPHASGTSNCGTSSSSGTGILSLNAMKSSSESLRAATDKGDNWGTIGEGDSGSRIGKSSSDDRTELGVAKTSKCGAGNISKTNGTSCEIGRSGTEGHDGRMPVGMLGSSKSESETLSDGPEMSRRGQGASQISSTARNFVLDSFLLSSSTIGTAVGNSLSDGLSTD